MLKLMLILQLIFELMLQLKFNCMFLIVPRLQEEGSWDEDGRGGGILPRLFGAWEWSIEELAAFTAVRQLMLVPEQDFNPVRMETLPNDVVLFK